MRPLPEGLFPVFEEAQRPVHRDGHVEFKRAYYSAPPEYVGCTVWVRQESRLLHMRNTRRGQIALHALAEPGKFTTDAAHLHSRKRHLIERGVDHLLERCRLRLLGPLTGIRAETMHQTRVPQSLRVMLGLLQLAEKHRAAELEKAARVATTTAPGTLVIITIDFRQTSLAELAVRSHFVLTVSSGKKRYSL